MKLDMKLILTLLTFILFIGIVKGACNDLEKKYCNDFFGGGAKEVYCSAHSGSNGIGYACHAESNKNNFNCNDFQTRCLQLCTRFKLDKVEGENESYCNKKDKFCTCRGKIIIT
jgi:hypothetical protein